MKVLNVNNLDKAYHKTPILKGLSFSIEPGEMFGFAGVNGAGKSTFIKCMLDFCSYESGTIEIYGVSSKKTEARQRLAFLPERFIPPFYLTGEQFLRFILSLQGAAYNKKEALSMLEQIDLHESALSKPVRSFSKGMTQKLGLLGCFMAKRDFYVLDEPMSGLDPKARALVKKQFDKLQENGATLFFTSHSLSDIEEVCTRMAVLHDGQIYFNDKTEKLREQFPHCNTLEKAYLELITQKR